MTVKQGTVKGVAIPAGVVVSLWIVAVIPLPLAQGDVYTVVCGDITLAHSGVLDDKLGLANVSSLYERGNWYRWVQIVKFTEITDLKLLRVLQGNCKNPTWGGNPLLPYGVKKGGIYIDGGCQAVLQVCGKTPTTDTTSSISNDVIIGIVAGVLGLLLVASAVMYVYWSKKRKAEEELKMENERQKAQMEMERAQRDLEMQMEQQRAMQMESQLSASVTSLEREVQSLRMKDIEQQQELEQLADKEPETGGLVQQISTLMFGPQPPGGHSLQQSRSGAVQQGRRQSRHHSPSQHLVVGHPGSMGQLPSRSSVRHPGSRGQSPSQLMVHPSQMTSYNGPQQQF